MRKYGSDSNSQTRGGVSNIMPLSQSDVKDIRALNLPHVLSRGSSHQVKRVIASHSEYQITSLPLFQAHSNGVVSFQMPKSRSDLSSGHLCFLRFSLCHFCVIFRHIFLRSKVRTVCLQHLILHLCRLTLRKVKGFPGGIGQLLCFPESR